MNPTLKYLRAGLYATIMGGALATAPSHAEQISMESAGANNVVGVLPQALSSHWADNGVDIQLSLNQTLTRSLLKLGLGRLDSAFVPPFAYDALKQGTGPYAEMGDQAADLAGNVRSLFSIPTGLYHPITWADAGIREWSDAEGERIFIGPPGGAANEQITSLIEAGGLSEGEYTPVKAPWGAANQAFQDGQYDVYVGAFGLGSQALAELSLSRDIYLLSVGDVEPPKGTGLQLSEIPPNTYPGQVNEEAIHAWQLTMLMMVNKDISEEVAYQLTKTYFEHRDQLANNNKVLAYLSDSNPFAGVDTPLHPGAVRYYQEAGMSIPERLLTK
ncbi:TAXI family TRAP transporter solute-binding subunit [Halomonas ramblicola]|uniref:TAXI family TRAP transporter solute-binding subunit n=1 Tax=Halomonas ramblicola TaxID=747349 RepID=UPI0025B42E9B|nr:TAXI family TRAP transporter solute-binding subunit [Halomonas ramblicola]MDN3521993.1 TAXI family TRAP transporter solute-binding subunit [Halomonas ramblicola]